MMVGPIINSQFPLQTSQTWLNADILVSTRLASRKSRHQNYAYYVIILNLSTFLLGFVITVIDRIGRKLEKDWIPSFSCSDLMCVRILRGVLTRKVDHLDIKIGFVKVLQSVASIAEIDTLLLFLCFPSNLMRKRLPHRLRQDTSSSALHENSLACEVAKISHMKALLFVGLPSCPTRWLQFRVSILRVFHANCWKSWNFDICPIR